MFQDRIEAGIKLAKKLAKFKSKNGVVLAVPRGGVPIAYVIAKSLGLPLDLVLTKKIGHPANKEYAIGAVSMNEQFVIPHEGVSEDYIERETIRIRKMLKDMYADYLGQKEPESIRDKTVLVIDDGIATGNTLLATISMLRKQKPAAVVIAVPVASRSAINKLSKEVDEIICLLVPEDFYGVGAFYVDFSPVSDDEVKHYLHELNNVHTVPD